MKNSAKFYNKSLFYYISGIVFLALSAYFSLSIGSTQLKASEIINALTDFSADSIPARIFWYVRLPRTMACIFCGAALSVSGAVIQRVLANKLASPGIIGVNSGAGLAVTLCTAFGIYGGWQFSLFAFLGALLSVMTVSVISRRLGASKSTVILIGVALNSLFNAIADTVITFDPDVGVMSNDFKIGEFSSVTYQKLIPSVIVIAVTLFALFTLTNELDVIGLGQESAESLGLNTGLYRTLFLIFSALLAGCAVSLAGLLSFVGLIVPHIISKIAGSSAKRLLPMCALFGGGFVTLCDTAARTLFAPYEIPVGIIMSFLGVPFFVFILIKKKGGHADA